HGLHEPGALQRVDAARGEGEVDGAPAARCLFPRVVAALVQGHAKAAAGGQGGEQRAAQTRADDGDVPLHGRHASPDSSRTAARSRSTKSCTSSKPTYSGAGATRITLGSRQSAITLRLSRRRNSDRASSLRSSTTSESWQPRACGGVM